MHQHVVFNVAHMFGAIGGGAKGFKKAQAIVGNMRATFRCIGSVDVDPAANRDFARLVGVPATTLDLFDREQYIAFHGKQLPAGWREATPADLHHAYGHQHPHVLFLSAPCKGFSGLLSETKSLTDKYQALNRLTVRAVWLALEAFKDDPVELFVFENVPRIATRGRHLLDQIAELFRAYGYAWRETDHNCGELGGLAQSRKRFLGVARHTEKVPPFLYEPDKKPLRAVGDVLGKMPLPSAAVAGPMHRIPELQWKTWVRLAFVEAGSDWRSLNKLAIENGVLRDYLLVPTMHRGGIGVHGWDEPAGTISSRGGPTNGAYSVADPRPGFWPNTHPNVLGVMSMDAPAGTITSECRPTTGRFTIADPRFNQSPEWNDGHAYGVTRWDEHSATITSRLAPGSGYGTVADPRTGTKHNNCFRIVAWDRAAGTVTGGGHPSAGGQSIADPRVNWNAVTPYDAPAGTVISGSTTGQGAFAVADPRPNMARGKGDHYLTGGHYGVVPWEGTSYAVSASACHDNGHWSVADPRPMPAPTDKLVARIRALDGTWHRPFTTLELAALQSLVDPEDTWVPWRLDGESDQAWRERIGNAVPPDAAQAIAEVMGETLLLARMGETFLLSSRPVWVRPVTVALSVQEA